MLLEDFYLGRLAVKDRDKTHRITGVILYQRGCCNNFQTARFGIDVALLLPDTRGQKERGDATVKLGQRGVNVLKWSKLGFSGDPI
jgi:hypothetical protein